MKKLFIAFITLSLLTTNVSGITIVDESSIDLPQYFRDVSAKGKLNIAIDSAIKRGILESGSFFRPNDDLPAIMFWEVILKDSEFNAQDSKNSFIEEAFSRELINEEEFTKFKQFESITKFQVIKTLIKTKKLLPPRRVSQKFREIYKLIDNVDSKYLPYIETAYASGMINIGDLNYFYPEENVSREEFITWIYNYFNHGKRQSKIEADKSFRWNKRSFRTPSGLSLKSNFTQKETAPKIPRKNSTEKNLKLRVLPKKEVQELEDKTIPSFPGKEVMDEVYNEIINKYRFIGELDPEKRQEMVNRAISSLVKGIGDRYSSYVEPKKSEDFVDKLQGEFEGIGAYVEMIDDNFTIMSPIVGSPAEKYGLLSGDIITHVDDVDVAGMNIGEIVDLIMGPAGTKVKLKILRDKISRDFEVVRAKIVEPVVTLKWKKGVPIISIHQFNHNTITALEEKVTKVLAKKIRGIIIDLRNNPGGHLQSAIDVSSVFLKEGMPIFYMEDRIKTIPFFSKKDGLLSEVSNLVVLQNGGSASAAEILIGALKENRRATIIGTKSLGKGTVQNVINLQNGGLLKLTVAKWLTPNKNWIHEKGIVPDLEVSIPTQAERENEIDRQLDAAIRKVLNS